MAGKAAVGIGAMAIALTALGLVPPAALATQTPLLGAAAHVLLFATVSTFFLGVALVYMHLHAAGTAAEHLANITAGAASVTILLVLVAMAVPV